MEAFLLYILKSAVISSLFLLIYLLLLRKDTSFQLNRSYLLAGIFTAVSLPALEFIHYKPVEAPINNLELKQFLMENPQETISGSGGTDLWLIAGFIYLTGLLFFLLKFILQLKSLSSFLRSATKKREGDFTFIETQKDVKPFSFFHYITYNPKAHAREELELILRHEKVHAREWHSADVLIVNLATAFLWFSPLMWLYKQYLLQNLEYIADRKAIALTGSKTAYQKALIRTAIGDHQPVMANHFYQSFIKKRIIMLNKTTSSNHGLLKTISVIPFLVTFFFLFQVRTEAQVITGSAEPAGEKEADKVQVQRERIRPATTKDTLKQRKLVTPGTNAGTVEKTGEITTDSESTATLNYESQNSGISYSFSPGSQQPLFVVDGKVQTPDFDSGQLDPNQIKSINVLKGENATEKYGERGRNGVIEITLKSAAEQIIETSSSNSPDSVSKVRVTTFSNVSSEAEQGTTITISGRANSANSQQSSPLYVLDGNVMATDFDSSTIDPDSIESITVLKGDRATDKYGERAADGVIEISTKKE